MTTFPPTKRGSATVTFRTPNPLRPADTVRTERWSCKLTSGIRARALPTILTFIIVPLWPRIQQKANTDRTWIKDSDRNLRLPIGLWSKSDVGELALSLRSGGVGQPWRRLAR